MKNPFVYGKEVSGDSFCDREEETKELCRDIFNSQNVIVFSQRRFGKTSLLKKVLDKCQRGGILAIYVDLYPVLTEEDFVRLYGKVIVETIYGKFTKKLKDISRIFTRIRPTVSVDNLGNYSWSIDVNKSEILPSLGDVLESVERYSKFKKKKVVVCFDEFQQISLFKTDKVQKMMRSSFQKHKNISYIFMGSKKHLIFDIFNNPSKPFYKSGKSFPLCKIKDKELLKFAQHKFKQSGKAISRELLSEVIKECETHPYYFQYLCHIIWERTVDRKNIESQDFVESRDLLLERASSTYEACWDSLTIRQRQALMALAKTLAGEQIFSHEYLQKHNLGSASTLQRILQSLRDKDLVDKEKNKYSIIDVFFKKWIFALR